jgi:hypothetical protein
MNCADFDARLSDYIDEELSPTEMTAMRRHTLECGPCRAKHDDMLDALRELRSTQPIRASADFETRVITTTHMMTAAPAPARQPILVRMWVPLAAAAGLLIVFVPLLLVLMIRLSTHDSTIRDLNARLEEIKRRPAAAPPKPAPSIRPEEVVFEFVTSMGLVPHEGSVVPQSIRDHILRGDCYVKGQWVSKEEAAKMLEGPAPVPTPPAPDEDALVRKWFEKNGYVKIGDSYFPANYRELARAGKLPLDPPPTVPIDRQRIIEDFLKERDLVEFEGELMSRKRADALAMERAIEPPSTQVVAEVKTLLSGLRIARPTVLREISLYPLLEEGAGAAETIAPLSDAVSSGRFLVTETQQIFVLSVENRGASPVFIPMGTVFTGGKFDRIARTDLMVAASGRAQLPVYCAQPTGYSTRGRTQMDAAGHLAPLSLRRSARQARGQAAVWSSTLELIETLGIDRKDPSLQDLYSNEEVRGARGDADRASEEFLRQHPRARGIAIGFGSRLALVQVYATAELLASQLSALIYSCMLEQILLGKGRELSSQVPNEIRDLKTFIQAAFKSQARAGDLGTDLVIEGRFVGAVTPFKGRPVALTLFAGDLPDRPIEAQMKLSARVIGPKLDRVMSEYNSLLAPAAPAQRIAILKEVAAIGAPQVKAILARHYYDKDIEVRKVSLELTAARQDVSAMPELTKLFDESKRDLPMLAIVSRTLASLPGDKGIEFLVKKIRFLEIDLAASKVVIEAIGDALGKMRSRAALDESMTHLINFYSTCMQMADNPPPGTNLDPKMRLQFREAGQKVQEVLKGLTGQDFANPSEAMHWWNKNREEFIKKITEQ